jgi:hypothetical protein
MYLAVTTVRFTAVTLLAKQLDVRSVTAPSARKRHDMVVLQTQRASTTLAGAAVPGIDDLLGGLRNIPAL